MKLVELHEAFEHKKIFHATNARFTKFKPAPTWFSTDEAVAHGWHFGNVTNDTITLVCEFTGGKIAAEHEVDTLAKQIWPEDPFIYSMFDENVGEFDKDDVRAFVKLFKDKGFDAAFHEDYDPRDYNSGLTISLCVFRPDLHVKILSEHEFKK